MDREMYECALNGDITLLKEIMLRDERILERSASSPKGNNILHIAAIYGHVQFALEVVKAKPELSSELNEAGLSPLHLAAAKGHLDLVNLLLAVDPDLSNVKDKHGRLPAHTAAMKGKLDVLKKIISFNPWCLVERTDTGETVLHLSVKENRTEVVELLMTKEELKTLINEGDCSGNTALHLAASRNQKEIIKILMNSGTTVNVHALNKYAITAYDLIRLREPNEDDEIVRLLNPNNSPVASRDPAFVSTITNQSPETTFIQNAEKASAKQAGNVMIVAILIATVTYQGALTPPGGFWQDNSTATENLTSPESTTKLAVASSALPSGFSPNNTTDRSFISNSTSHISSQTAGTAIIGAKAYDGFMAFDIAAFVNSFFVIILLLLLKISVFPPTLVLCGLLVNILLALLFLTLAFYFAVDATKPEGSNATRTYTYQLMGWIISCFISSVLFYTCPKVVNCVCRIRACLGHN